jgi:hypothetical protein
VLETGFVLFLFLPSVGLAFVVLASYYGSTRAYLAISWVPLALVAVLEALRRLAFLGDPAGDLGPFARAVAWTSLVQAAFGVCLLGLALRRRARWPGLLAATIVVCAAAVLALSL